MQATLATLARASTSYQTPDGREELVESQPTCAAVSNQTLNGTAHGKGTTTQRWSTVRHRLEKSKHANSSADEWHHPQEISVATKARETRLRRLSKTNPNCARRAGFCRECDAPCHSVTDCWLHRSIAQMTAVGKAAEIRMERKNGGATGICSPERRWNPEAWPRWKERRWIVPIVSRQLHAPWNVPLLASLEPSGRTSSDLTSGARC